MIKSVTVFCSSSDAVAENFFEIAIQLGKCLAQHNLDLIYGGSAVGLMGKLASTVKDHGGKIIGVIPHHISSNVPHLSVYDELIHTDTMHERKKIMEERGDAFLALPGGFGTLEELLEIITLKQLQYHQKPIVILNAYGCYDALLDQFEYLFSNALAKPSYRTLFHVVSTPEEAISYFQTYEYHGFESKWFDTINGYS